MARQIDQAFLSLLPRLDPMLPETNDGRLRFARYVQARAASAGGPCSEVPAADPAYVSNVRDRLGFFLEMIDRCDVLFFERVGDRLIFLVCAQVEEHLPLIRDAIAGEHLLLAELGIDRHDVEVRGDVIRIVVPAPGDSLAS